MTDEKVGVGVVRLGETRERIDRLTMEGCKTCKTCKTWNLRTLPKPVSPSSPLLSSLHSPLLRNEASWVETCAVHVPNSSAPVVPQESAGRIAKLQITTRPRRALLHGFAWHAPFSHAPVSQSAGLAQAWPSGLAHHAH